MKTCENQEDVLHREIEQETQYIYNVLLLDQILQGSLNAYIQERFISLMCVQELFIILAY